MISNTLFTLISPFLLLAACSQAGQNRSADSLVRDTIMIQDIDGNTYTRVRIGKQVWLRENLMVSRYRNGDSISYVSDGEGWAETSGPAYCCYENDTGLAAVYGHLYNWYAVDDPRGLCPAGWRIPSDSDWTELSMYLGGPNMAGAKMKEEGFSHWRDFGVSSSNASGFTGLPAGHRDETGNFERLGTYCFFWSADDYTGDACQKGQSCAFECSLQGETSYFLQDWGFKKRGMSVRCIQE